ncbi:MAG: FHA domain-containing protein [Myxococcales bacterium]|nr:FHA domain-containing protein [Myxococcales bacterium]
MLKLIIEDDEGKTTVVPLIRDEITIGRKEGNTIRLTERNVSRRHARLVRTGEGVDHSVIVEDLDSYNGIKLNGDRVSGKCVMRPGDLVQIGDYSLALQADQPSPVTGDQAIIRGDAATLVSHGRLGADAQTRVHTVPDTDLLAKEGHGKLVVVSSNLGGETYLLSRREIIIGRTDENDVVVNHRSISRNHAKIVVRDGTFTVIDLASSNGVRVNGEPFGTVTLVNGDIIELGHVKMRFVAPGEHYVFTPADIDDVSDTSSTSTVRLVIIALVLAAIAVGTFFAVRKGGNRGPTATVSAPSLSTAGSSAARPHEAVDVGSLVSEGELHVASQRWSEAQRVFERALQATPENERARTGRATAEREARNQADFDRLALAAENAEWADAYLGLSTFPADSHYSPSAKSVLARVEPRFTESELARGRALIAENDLSGARAVQQALGQRQVREAETLRREIRTAERRAARPETAQTSPSQAASEVPSPASEKRVISGGRMSDEKYEESMKEALKLALRGNREDAAALLERLHQERPGDTLPHQRLCSIYRPMGKLDKALYHCKKLLQKTTNPAYKPQIQRDVDAIEAEMQK